MLKQNITFLFLKLRESSKLCIFVNKRIYNKCADAHEVIWMHYLLIFIITLAKE